MHCSDSDEAPNSISTFISTNDKPTCRRYLPGVDKDSPVLHGESVSLVQCEKVCDAWPHLSDSNISRWFVCCVYIRNLNISQKHTPLLPHTSLCALDSDSSYCAREIKVSESYFLVLPPAFT